MNRRLALLALAAASLVLSACADLTAPSPRPAAPRATSADSTGGTAVCGVWSGGMGATC